MRQTPSGRPERESRRRTKNLFALEIHAWMQQLSCQTNSACRRGSDPLSATRPLACRSRSAMTIMAPARSRRGSCPPRLDSACCGTLASIASTYTPYHYHLRVAAHERLPRHAFNLITGVVGAIFAVWQSSSVSSSTRRHALSTTLPPRALTTRGRPILSSSPVPCVYAQALLRASSCLLLLTTIIFHGTHCIGHSVWADRVFMKCAAHSIIAAVIVYSILARARRPGMSAGARNH